MPAVTEMQAHAQRERKHSNGNPDRGRREADAEARAPTLNVAGLSVSFGLSGRTVRAVRDLDLTVDRGQVMGIVGESGSGKSTAALAIAHLLPASAESTFRVLELEGASLADRSREEWRVIRGKQIGFIFQDPAAFLNPMMRIGDQIAEGPLVHSAMSRRAIRDRVYDLLAEVGIGEPRAMALAYPHQLSGGMQQRVMIAMALARDPILLLADEPTTALDVTTQAQILDLLVRLAQERGMATVLITHDFGVAARVCDHVTVMYGGETVESAPIVDIFFHRRMPYTDALLRSVPSPGVRQARLVSIEGGPPDLSAQIAGCSFAKRCNQSRAICSERHPLLSERGNSAHLARCFATEVGGWWNPK